MKKLAGLAFSIAVLVASVAAQTVTGSGTTNTVPVFTGASTVGNSPISISGSNVGIGTTTPTGGLSVASGDTGTYWIIPAWSGKWSIFGPNVGSANGAAVGIGYDATDNLGVLVSLAPNVTWEPMDYNAESHTFYTHNVPAMTINSSSNVGIGTTSPGATLEVDGNVKLTRGSGASLTFADGTVQSTAFTGVLCGGDYAESMDIDGDRANVEPGDVLVLDEQHQGKVLKSAEPYSTMVAGIFSTRPGVVGRRQKTPKSNQEVPMAMIGIVPTKVSTENGPIKVGDLLVSSSLPGYAMRGTDRSRMLGAVIGKAMGTLDSGKGVIEVLVTLQ